MTSSASLALAGLSSLLFAGCATDAGQADGDDADTVSTSYDEIVARYGDHDHDHERLPNHIPVGDANGIFETVSANGGIDLKNEFFQDLGTNGRRCVSCHVPTSGWTITPGELRTVFNLTDGGKFEDGLGLSAVFRTVDGSNSPNADVSTLAKRKQAYSMLLNRGVIRIGLPVPATAEFELIAVDDPYKFASAKQLSLFRRPPPVTNVKLISTVMWDGREVVPGETVEQELQTQASDATVLHAQGQPLPQATRASIVNFITGLATAQTFDFAAGNLSDAGAKGGPDTILAQPFYIGINDNFGDSKTGAPFNPVVFNIYDKWANVRGAREEARRQIARGQAIFNTKPISITGVSGINDEAVFGTPAKLIGSCTTCHDTPNGGAHSIVAPLNIGLVDASRRTPDMPLYTLRNKTTGQTVQVTDPGRAMVDGKWAHIGRFKGANLRDLAPRAPYFHNGSAKDLAAVVDFYDERFTIGFTKQERADLIAFLRTL